MRSGPHPRIDAPRPPRAAARIALLLIDLISDFSFEDGAAVARAARRIAKPVGALKARARAAGLPTVFVNDHFGHWRSDFRQLVARCRQRGCEGAALVEELAPDPRDYYILKPTHAGFYATPLEQLLRHFNSETLILTGLSAHQCVLFTANEAYLRGFKLIIPSDCVASKTAREKRFALEYFADVLHADVRPSTRVRLPRR